MAHELEILENGEASMFSGEGITPWHGLGKVVDGVKTASEALKLASLDWTVEKQPLYFGKDRDLFSGRHATVRTSDQKELGIVGDNYNVFQNEESFTFFDTVVESNDAKYTSAGSLFGGKRVFLTAKVGDTFNVLGEDAHDQYLLITNSHDGSQAFTAAITTIRAVCNNTVTFALQGAKTRWTLRHQTSLAGKVQEARDALQMTYKYQDAFEESVRKLIEIEVDKDAFNKIIEDIVPPSKLQHAKAVESLMNVFETEPTVNDAFGAGSAWGAYNAVTFWADHVKDYTTVNSRFNSLVNNGFGEKLRTGAHSRLLSLV